MTFEPDNRSEHAKRVGTVGAFVLICLLVAVLVIGFVLVSAAFGVSERRGHYAPGSSATRFTEATLNVRKNNTAREISSDVTAAMRRASVVRLQEVYSPVARKGVRHALATHRWWRSYPANVGRAPAADAILYSTKRWRATGAPHDRGYRQLTSGVRRLTPARFVVWLTLARAVRGAPARDVTFVNTHAVSGYCKSHRPRAALRDRIAARHWRGLAAWTRQQRARHPHRSILLGGDFNCSLSRSGAGTPGQYLRSLYAFDRSRGIDHLTSLRVSGRPRVLDRWSVAAHSDHRLHLRTLSLPRR